jgi:hypothetical protein
MLSAQLQRDNCSRDEPASKNVQNGSSGEFQPQFWILPFTCIFATAHILHKINAFSKSDAENILNR